MVYVRYTPVKAFEVCLWWDRNIRAGGTGPADPATAGPILTKSPIATHNHDLCQTLSRAICNF